MARALGRYELLRPLARGGMAEVYLARRRAGGIEKWLVVKRMRPETSRDPRFLDLFVREARLSMSLVHQNIVPVFDFGRIDDQVFLAMERVEGKDLGSSLARGAAHRMPPLLAAFIAAECCQALDYAHQRKSPDGTALGIVHRDVTPRNVLLSWSGEIKLTDFGIAALAGDATSRLLGTPHYMAPEQARSEPIDPRADIYALGLVLREAATGVRPRPGNDRDSVLDAARRGELVPWPSGALPIAGELALGTGDHSEPLNDPASEPRNEPRNEPLPVGLRAIIDRATAPLPADRYPDARSMLEALDGFIVEERSARKGESPARQLAAWLAVVWEGARDDLEADAKIDGDHLVSFIDDGALDVIGTGTVRSLIATSADSQPVRSPIAMGAPIDAPIDARIDAPIDAPVDVPALRAAADAPLRPGRVSSSHVTVASGSFEALEAAAEAGPPASQLAPTQLVRPRRSIGLWIGVVLAGAAAAAVVLYFGRSEPPPAPRPDPVATVSPPPVQAPPPVQEPPPTPPPETPSVGSGSAIKPPHPRPNPGRPTGPISPAIRPTSPLPPPIGEPAPARPGCKVRVNFTPWAYYTTDGDSTRRETPSTVELPPGKHRLHVWNPELHIERDITINVPADRDSMNYSEPLATSRLP